MVITDRTDPSGNSFAYPKNGSVAQAWADWVNAHGGINGRKVNLIICDAQVNANKTADCAREAVQDHVSAVVASYAANSAVIEPILAPAKIPYTSSYPVAPSDYNAPIDFPTTSTPFILSGMGYIAGKLCKHPTLMSLQQPSLEFNDKAITAGVKAGGGSLVRTIVVPQQVTDYAPIASQAIQGSDCLIVYGGITMASALYPALEHAGATQRIIGLNSQTIGHPVDESNPKLTQDGINAGIFPPYSSPVWNNYKAMTAKYGSKKYDYQDFGAQLTYGGLLVFQNLIASMPTSMPVTAANVLATLKSTTSLSTGGLFPPFNFTKPYGVSGFTRLFDQSVTFSLVKTASVGLEVALPGQPQFTPMGAIFAKGVG
ncbi:MAG TPA: ABC transporter substrate-binding protein [Streptosporangiaceae bacterium]|nr:ABC transporter substrate-binding protein [Streptosporangiaceae bacterium]